MKMQKGLTADFVVIGAGIVGLSIARELRRRYTDCQVLVLEKEKHIGEHASGRNSGVLHAGFYYTKDSLKAKFTREGNHRLHAYCQEKKIPINACGKLVVARHEADLKGLKELLQRGQTNGIKLEWITEQQAQEIEPRIKTFGYALFSPTTSSVSPQQVMEQVLTDAREEGIQVLTGVKYLNNGGCLLQTNQGEVEGGYIVNTAGLYADQIAKNFSFSRDYTILPFKGLYLYASSGEEKLRTHVYPVPDLRNPFLGVHFTLTVEGKVKIGPTAIPAFWREHYHGFSRFSFLEMLEVLTREFGLFMNAGFDFRKLALEEVKKYSRSVLTKRAAELVKDIHPSHYKTWGRPGIRAQLLNIKKRTLEMDFIVEGDHQSMHVLNAVSPAFTCAFPFAEHVVDLIEMKLNGKDK